jgi:hypothetical protein
LNRITTTTLLDDIKMTGASMKRAFKLAALGLAGLLILSLVLAIAPYFLLSGIRESHISANVPDHSSDPRFE